MGRLYDACQQIMTHIDQRGLDPYKTRGEIALRTGFLISMVDPDDDDDPVKLESVLQAALEVLNLHVNV